MPRRFRLRPVTGLAALVGLSALLAVGCSAGGGSSAAPGGLEKTNLRVAAVPAVDSAGLYIAQQRGLFAAEGLHVTIVPAISGKTTINSQLAGQFDVTSGNYVSYILANADPQAAGLKKPADFRVLAPGSIMESNNQDIMVPPGSDIQTVSELKNKTIAVNVTHNIGQLLVSSILNDNAVPVNSVRFVPIEFPDMAKALQDHQVDAAWAPEPFITRGRGERRRDPAGRQQPGHDGEPADQRVHGDRELAEEVPEHRGGLPPGPDQGPDDRGQRPGGRPAGDGGLREACPQIIAAIEALPQFPTQMNAALLARLEQLMLHFDMIGQ